MHCSSPLRWVITTNATPMTLLLTTGIPPFVYDATTSQAGKTLTLLDEHAFVLDEASLRKTHPRVSVPVPGPSR